MRAAAKGCARARAEKLTSERQARVSAVRLVRAARRCSLGRGQVARSLGLHERTIRQWEERWRRDRLCLKARGRQSLELSRDQRRQALDAWRASLGRIGVPSLLLAIQPRPARRALARLKARWRRALHRRGGSLCTCLSWTRPGSVWAMDWTNPEMPVDGVYQKIFVVRDLASGENLLSRPSPAESENLAARELSLLIAQHGAPLVLKSDNGTSLCAKAVRLTLAANKILALVSPPACPGYNGACEAGIGALQVQIHYIAAASGRERAWACDDVLMARQAVNTRVRENGLSAEDLWKARRPITPEEREQLWSAYRAELRSEFVQRGHKSDSPLTHSEQTSLDRAAISRALAEVNLVQFRRQWIRPPIRSQKLPRIS